MSAPYNPQNFDPRDQDPIPEFDPEQLERIRAQQAAIRLMAWGAEKKLKEREKAFREAQARLNWVKTRQEILDEQQKARQGLPPRAPTEASYRGDGGLGGREDSDDEGDLGRIGAESFHTARTYQTIFQPPDFPQGPPGGPQRPHPPRLPGRQGMGGHPKGDNPRGNLGGEGPSGPPQGRPRGWNERQGQYSLPPPAHFSIPSPRLPENPRGEDPPGEGDSGDEGDEKPKKPLKDESRFRCEVFQKPGCLMISNTLGLSVVGHGRQNCLSWLGNTCISEQ